MRAARAAVISAATDTWGEGVLARLCINKIRLKKTLVMVCKTHCIQYVR